jgi:hypothetical protein
MAAFRYVFAALLGVSCSIGPEPRDCAYGLDLDVLAHLHRSAWSATVDGEPLDDSQLLALADAQAVIECLAANR